ncbi:hypothetical protein JNJ66_04165 [Candidatus Saccharibacteria bacterium]|nr:hypothetical protein [Candidatus Saccharibacteria bacterium]
MSKGLKRGLFALMLLASISLQTLLSGEVAGAAAVHTDMGSYRPEYIYAHKDGSYNASICSGSSSPWTYSKTYSGAHAHIDSAQRDNNADWWAPSCDNVGMGVGLDDTVYVYEVKEAYGNYQRRLAAYRGNTQLWSQPFQAEACPSASTAEGKLAELSFPTIGYDGIVYVYAYAQSGCSSPDNRLYAVSALNGQAISSLALQTGNPANVGQPRQYEHIFPGENQVTFLDGTTVRTASIDKQSTAAITDDELVEQVSKAVNLAHSTSQFVIHASGNAAGYVYAILTPGPQSDTYNPNANCTGSVELAKATPDTSTTTKSTVPVNTCGFVPDAVTIAPDNGVIVLGAQPGAWGAYDDMLVKYSTSGTVVYNKDLNNLSGAGFATVRQTSQPVVDNNGVAVVVSTADVTQYSNSDRYVVVRKIDTSGNSSIVYASSDDFTMDPNGQDKFGASTKLDIQNGKAYFVSCKLQWYANHCSSASDSYVSVVDLTNVIGNRYPRSEPLSSYNYTVVDIDTDGLSKFHEDQQETSDYQADFDSDGINDYKESEWFADRVAAFCKTDGQNNIVRCAPPDPKQKDLYVQIDWVVDNNQYSTQPTANQLMPVILAFRAQGIEAHFDIGQSNGNNDQVNPGDDVADFGGGNALKYVSDVIDLDSSSLSVHDYKLGSTTFDTPSNFDSAKRHNIWRYMIFSKALPGIDVTGAALPGDDDVLIGYKTLKDLAGNDFDLHLGKAVMHELGHGLCLSSAQRYEAQDSSCVYSKVDDQTPVDLEEHDGYYGIMNYTVTGSSEPLSAVSYSGGTYSNDHDDWAAVEKGLDDFSQAKPLYDINLDGVMDANQNCQLTIICQ